jgi:hypothetical protein
MLIFSRDIRISHRIILQNTTGSENAFQHAILGVHFGLVLRISFNLSWELRVIFRISIAFIRITRTVSIAFIRITRTEMYNADLIRFQRMAARDSEHSKLKYFRVFCRLGQ